MNTLTLETNKATIVDVAKIAGVSIKTVSRVANREPNVRDETRARVQRAIDLLGYSANPYAQHMGSQSRPPARKSNTATSSHQGSGIQNVRQSAIETSDLAATGTQQKAAGSGNDREIDWW